MIYNIKEYGASGCGHILDTSAIQKALDACYHGGGGKVFFPAGRYLTGTIFIKDNTELCLENGAVIAGSPSMEDYNDADCFAQNYFSKKEITSGGHLIIAHEAENIAITGFGRIEGNSSAFIDVRKKNKKVSEMLKQGTRPAQMLYLVECKNVRISGLNLTGAPYWSCFLHGCRDVIVDGLTISTDEGTPNGDGLDIDSCQNVAVSNCIFDTTDDSLTLRCKNSRLKKKRNCENVVITNCILQSRKCGLRIGVGDGTIRNCRISNCVVNNCRTGIHLISKYGDTPPGVSIENITCSGIDIYDSYIPFWILSGEGADAHIQNIGFYDFRIRAESGSFISGLQNSYMTGIAFNNIDYTLTKSSRDIYEIPPPYPMNLRELNLKGKRLAHAFYLAKAKNVRIKGLRVQWEDKARKQTPLFLLNDVSDMRQKDIELQGEEMTDKKHLLEGEI